MKKANCLLWDFVSRFVSQGRILGVVVVALLLAATPMVIGESLEDFKTAAGYDKGVELIPFQDLRRDANSIAEDVQRRKGEVASFKYDYFEKRKDKQLKQIKQIKQKIQNAQKEVHELESDSDDTDYSAWIKSLEDEIKAREEKIQGIKAGKIKEWNDEMAKAVDSYDRLYQARAGLREYFDKALSKLSDAKSSPERYLGNNPSDDDKKKLKDYIDTIQDRIKSQMSTHKDEENRAKESKQNYENLIKKTE